MADLSLLLEAEKRGLLPPDKQSLLTEARSRGIVPPLATAPAPSVNEGIPAERQLPKWAQENPRTYEAAQAARTYLGPTVEALSMAGGGVLGSALGPLGTVGGAGLGYGMGRSLLTAADVALGNRPPETAPQALTRGAEDVLTGATLETGGRVIAPYIGKAIGKVIDVTQIPTQKAAAIARNALGPDLEMAKNMLAGAPTNVTAGQATANINSPAWQALVDRALNRDPRFLMNLEQAQGDVSLNALKNLVGGGTQTEAKAAQGVAKKTLNEALIPTLKTELGAANIAGEQLPKLQSQADRMAAAAASKVQDVRRFTEAGPRAEAAARTSLIEKNLPVGAAKYTYMGELAKKADEVATQAANASLPFGQAAQFAQAAANSLAAHGLKPLSAESVSGAISNIAKNPEFAGNDIIQGALKNVSNDIAKWTTGGGVIDAFALDSIRKNSINAAVQQLRPNMEATAQKTLAASVLNEIKPTIINAIENAGGTGYGQYLTDYAAGRQAINQMKLGAKAMDLFKNNKQGFIDLVEGNTPKEVEKIFGAGKYDLAKEMSADAMAALKGVSSTAAGDINIAKQATAGQEALKEILAANISKFRLPSFISAPAAVTNKTLQILEQKIGTKTMDALTEGLKSGQSATELLSTLPASERIRILKLLQSTGAVPKAAAGVLNQLAPSAENQNALAP